MKNKIVTIDGPAASGKEHIAKYISKKYNLKHLDSGILYRKIAFLLLKKKIKLDNLIGFRKLINIHLYYIRKKVSKVWKN